MERLREKRKRITEVGENGLHFISVDYLLCPVRFPSSKRPDDCTERKEK